MRKRGINIFNWVTENVVRVGESADGTWSFIKDDRTLAWVQKTSTGKWMYFKGSSIRFFKSLTEVIKLADRELAGGAA